MSHLCMQPFKLRHQRHVDNSKIEVTFMHHFSRLSANKDSNNTNIYLYMTKCHEIWLRAIVHHFLYFDYIMRLTPFDYLEVKCLTSHIFMSYVDARTEVKFNGSLITC